MFFTVITVDVVIRVDTSGWVLFLYKISWNSVLSVDKIAAPIFPRGVHFWSALEKRIPGVESIKIQCEKISLQNKCLDNTCCHDFWWWIY